METHFYHFENKRIDSFEYIFYLPEEVKRQDSIPLLLFLHGAGERAPDFKWMYNNGFPKYLEAGEQFPCAILCPQCPTPYTWNHLTVEVKELVDYIVKENGIDPTRISVTGLSMGGYGTWEMVCSYPDFFSAAAPICGGGMGWRLYFGNVKTPIWAFHGSDDPVVPLSASLDMYNSLKRKGEKLRLDIYHGEEHEIWDSVYHTTKVIEWLTAKEPKAFGIF